jgi:hypothetical protein
VTLHLKTASFATVAAIGGPRSTRRARRCQRTKRSMPAFGWITLKFIHDPAGCGSVYDQRIVPSPIRAVPA